MLNLTADPHVMRMLAQPPYKKATVFRQDR